MRLIKTYINIENMKRFHYDKETGQGYLIKNNDIDGKPTIKIAFKVKKNKMKE